MTVSITRSNSSLGAASNISVFITTTDPYPVLNGGVIQIYIPKVQISFSNINNVAIAWADTSTILPFIADTGNSDYYIFTITGWCNVDVNPTDGNCDSGVKQNFTISGVNNPNILA